jgi:hypothetical protein
MVDNRSFALFTESIAAFVGAAAIGVAGAFLTDKTVPRWMLLVIAAGGLALWVGAVVVQRPDRRDSGTVQTKVGAVCTVLLLAATTAAFVMAARHDPDFRSGYDDMDASLMDCINDARKLIGIDGPKLRDIDKVEVGHVEIRKSDTCDSVWAVAVLTDAAKRDVGRRIMFLLRREGDGKEGLSRVTVRPFNEGERRDREGLSNMLAVNNACVSAEVFFEGDNDDANHAKSSCVS